MSKLNKFLIVVSLICWSFLPLVSFASTSHTFVCGELTNPDGASCSSGSWSKASAFSVYDVSGLIYPMSTGTYYATFTVANGSGNVFNLTCTNGTCGSTAYSNGSYTDEPIVVSAATSGGIYFNGVSGGYLVGDICITDTIGGCAGGGGGGTPSTGDGELATTTQLVANPTQDLFNGFVLFNFSFWGIIWFFRKRN